MASEAQPSLPPAVIAGIKEAFGCILVGTIIATCVYGISILQAYIYFRKSGPQSTRMKSFVAFLFVLDTVSIALTVEFLFELVISDFGAPLSKFFKFPHTTGPAYAITVMMGTLTQCFFARRLWELSKRNIALVASIVVLAILSFGPGIGMFWSLLQVTVLYNPLFPALISAISVNLYTKSDIPSLSSNETRILSGLASRLSVVCDIVIVAALRHCLDSKRTGFKRTDLIIDRLIIYAVNRGILTALCQAGHMITTVALPRHFYGLAFGILEGKLYCNTLLATLNAQRSLREDGDNVMEMGTRILNRLNTSPQGCGDSRTAAGPLESVNASESTPTFVLNISTGQAMEKTAPAEPKIHKM
ncbi:hypothetical protein V8D89_006194 [Ganoderma adspersum]